MRVESILAIVRGIRSGTRVPTAPAIREALDEIRDKVDLETFEGWIQAFALAPDMRPIFKKGNPDAGDHREDVWEQLGTTDLKKPRSPAKPPEVDRDQSDLSF